MSRPDNIWFRFSHSSGFPKRLQYIVISCLLLSLHPPPVFCCFFLLYQFPVNRVSQICINERHYYSQMNTLSYIIGLFIAMVKCIIGKNGLSITERNGRHVDRTLQRTVGDRVSSLLDEITQRQCFYDLSNLRDAVDAASRCDSADTGERVVT